MNVVKSAAIVESCAPDRRLKSESCCEEELHASARGPPRPSVAKSLRVKFRAFQSPPPRQRLTASRLARAGGFN